MELSDLVTAAIGLIGVALGGGLQLWGQKKQNKDLKITQIRKECASLAKAANDFGSSLLDLGRVDDFLSENDYDELDPIIVERVEPITEAMREGMDGVENSAYTVETGDDHRLAEQASIIRVICRASFNEAYPTPVSRHRISSFHAGMRNKDIQHEIDILMAAVTPRKNEVIKRFRDPEFSGMRVNRQIPGQPDTPWKNVYGER